MPAFNEAENIRQVINSLPKQIENVVEIEVLVVDDGSTDDTIELAESLNASVISHHKNRGLGIAFHSALEYALDNNAKILVSIDADGQFDPQDIPDLIAPIQKGYAQMVTGNRFAKGKPANMPGLKYWGNKQISKIINYISKNQFEDVSCGFRAYSRDALYQLNLFGSYSYTHEVILNLAFKGYPIVEHPIDVKYFLDRKSKVASSITKLRLQYRQDYI